MTSNHKAVTPSGRTAAQINAERGRQRRAEIRLLLRADKSLPEIAKVLGITRQALHIHLTKIRLEDAEKQGAA